jgi:hypothetical protein
MTDPVRPWRDCWRVRCDCGDDGPRILRENCGACATATAVEHISRGHSPEIIPPTPERGDEGPKRLRGRRGNGW